MHRARKHGESRAVVHAVAIRVLQKALRVAARGSAKHLIDGCVAIAKKHQKALRRLLFGWSGGILDSLLLLFGRLVWPAQH